MKAPGRYFTLALFLFLVIPYFIKLKGKEPYPAILLPSGHGKASIGVTVAHKSAYTIYAYSENVEYELTTAQLLPGVPGSYAYYIVRNNLGFPIKTLKEKDKNSFKNFIMPWRLNKYEEREELEKYYEANVNLEIDSIHIIQNRTTIDYKKNDEVVEEKIVWSSKIEFEY